MSKFQGIFAICLLSLCFPPALSFYCWVDVKHTLSDRQPLILQASGNAFTYPAKTLSPKIGVEFFQTLRVACPGSSLVVHGNNLNMSEATVRCYALSFFQVLTTRHIAPLSSISCAERPVALAQSTNATCLNGTLAQVGFQLSDSIFVPTIPEICHNSTIGRTLWAHHKVTNAVRKRQHSLGLPPFSTGSFYPNITVNSTLFTADAQRQRLQTLLNDTNLVNTYIPQNGANFLVEGMLAPKSDMFYRLEQYSTFFYINTVPVWKSVNEKNWRQVRSIVRKLAKTFRKSSSLDVWTGGIDVLSLNNGTGTAVNITLATTGPKNQTGAIPVPRYLFKYVVDRFSNRGVAFITLNNPYAMAVSPADHLCEPLNRCRVLYPSFNQVERGYTYCCAVDSTSKFFGIAQSLGLPTFSTAEVLIKPYWNIRPSTQSPETPLNSTILSDAFWYLL